jgi:hypothetical protein
MNRETFSTVIDQTGLKLTDAQKTALFEAYPMFEAMVARATPALPREAEPSVIFQPEVR